LISHEPIVVLGGGLFSCAANAFRQVCVSCSQVSKIGRPATVAHTHQNEYSAVKSS